MNKPKSPAFQFYPADFLIGIMGMSDEEVGVYIKMLATQWLHGSLPVCKKTIKKMINSRKIPSEMVMRKFAICDDGFLRNERMEKVRKDQKDYKESSVESGKLGGNPNFKKGQSNPYYPKKDNPELSSKDNPPLSFEDKGKINSSSSSSSSILLLESERVNKAKNFTRPTPAPEFTDNHPLQAAASLEEVAKKINQLHPSWAKRSQLTYPEMTAMSINAAYLLEVSDDDWHKLKAYYDAPISEAEEAVSGKFWRPDGRTKFIEAIADILTHADRWERLQTEKNL